MQKILTTKSGAQSITEIIEDEHGGEIVTHYVINAEGVKSTKTCTCTCLGKGSASKTCDSSSNPICNCTGSTASIIC